MCQIREQHAGEPQRTRNCSGNLCEDPRKKFAVGCSRAIVKSKSWYILVARLGSLAGVKGLKAADENEASHKIRAFKAQGLPCSNGA